jgi:ABC-type glycerol-3-phosphate transport system substrate-binding protein
VSKVVGKNGYTPIPYEKENWQSVGMCGPLWVNKYISPERAKETFRFLAWMTDKGGQAWDVMMQTGGSVAPVLKKQLTDPEILSRLPVVAAYSEMKNFVPIPVMWPEFTEIQRIILMVSSGVYPQTTRTRWLLTERTSSNSME